MIVGATMLGRAATLKDVGNVAAFAASDHARAITGSTINITCGTTVDWSREQPRRAGINRPRVRFPVRAMNSGEQGRREMTTTAPLHPAGELPLMQFVQALYRCASLEQLGRSFAAGFGRLTAVPMYGFNVVDPGTTRLRHHGSVGVSDVFVTRYIREIMDDDPLRVRAHESGRGVYNLDLMSPVEWEESHAYRRAFSMHRMRHVVEAPMMAGGQPIGSVHFATETAQHDVGPADLRRAEARPAGDGPFSRRVEVELLTGESAMLLADSSPLHADGSVLVTVLELRREHAHVSPGALAALTTREADVAALVVDGLADREIAETLLLSRHTVSQYVKRIYRKLDVDSRVGLTRLLLGAPRAG
jgi:DNA-binding CsgD family transcriptional regulator